MASAPQAGQVSLVQESNRPKRPPRVSVLGIGVDAVTMDSALAYVEQFIEEGGPSMIVTADSHGIVEAQSDVQWRDIMLGADLVTPDSEGVVWASQRVGSPVRERVSGVELVDRVCQRSAEKGYRLYFLGGAEGVADQAADVMKLRHPGVNIVGTHHGFFTKSSEREVVKKVRDANVDVLFVAMGIPKQEKFIADHRYEMAAKAAMGVGGSLDVWSGNVKRAPIGIRRIRMEWLWRLIMNPRKWKKASRLPRFWWLVMKAGRSR